MKAIVINGSPDMDRGKTAKLLNPFLEGFKASGGEYELIKTECMNVNPCRECTVDSRFESPGRCYQDDDMNDIYSKMQEADVWIFAAPNYYNGMPGYLKNFLDRMEPLFIADITNDSLDLKEKGSMVFISDCSFWDMEMFDPIVEHFEAVAHLYNRNFAGALLRPHSFAMDTLEHLNIKYDDVFQAAYDAGNEVAKRNNISNELKKAFSRVLLPRESSLKDIVDFFENED
jgi:multimeric flavodoxin WrbA